MAWLMDVVRQPAVELLSLVLAAVATELARRARARAAANECRLDAVEDSRQSAS